MGLTADHGAQRGRRLAQQLGGQVDAVLCMSPENIYFLTGFRTMLYTRFTAAYVRLDASDSPVLFAVSVDRPLIEGKVWSPPWTDRVVYHGTHAGIPATPRAALEPYLRGVRRLGVDALRLPDVAIVEQAAPAVQIVNVTAELDTVRLLKGPEEVAFLGQANRLALRGVRTAHDLVAAGPTTELEIAVALDAYARRNGADGFGYPTLVSCGAKMLAAHSPALPRPVEPHQPLRIAFGPTVEGYTADVVRTMCLGEPPAELGRLQDGFLAAQDALLRLLRPGASVPELMAAVRAEYERRDLMPFWRNNIGHGVGLTIHEPPRVGGQSRDVLHEGMVVAIEPSLMIPGFGGYAHCDVAHITGHGCDLLTPDLQGIVRA